jgi:hypothetical protein
MADTSVFLMFGVVKEGSGEPSCSQVPQLESGGKRRDPRRLPYNHLSSQIIRKGCVETGEHTRLRILGDVLLLGHAFTHAGQYRYNYVSKCVSRCVSPW